MISTGFFQPEIVTRQSRAYTCRFARTQNAVRKSFRLGYPLDLPIIALHLPIASSTPRETPGLRRLPTEERNVEDGVSILAT